METGNNVLASDIVGLLPDLSRYSFDGLQRFIESGVLSDIVTVSQSGRCRFPFFARKHAEASAQRGTACLGQLERILDEVPTDNVLQWEAFLVCFKGWSRYASMWDVEIPYMWRQRDSWRADVKLERLNPIIRPDGFGADILLKRIGRQKHVSHLLKVMKLEEYRFATLDELSCVSLSSLLEHSKGLKIAPFQRGWFELMEGGHKEFCPSAAAIGSNPFNPFSQGGYLALVRV